MESRLKKVMDWLVQKHSFFSLIPIPTFNLFNTDFMWILYINYLSSNTICISYLCVVSKIFRANNFFDHIKEFIEKMYKFPVTLTCDCRYVKNIFEYLILKSTTSDLDNTYFFLSNFDRYPYNRSVLRMLLLSVFLIWKIFIGMRSNRWYIIGTKK